MKCDQYSGDPLEFLAAYKKLRLDVVLESKTQSEYGRKTGNFIANLRKTHRTGASPFS